MNSAALLDALGLPPAAFVDRRISKQLLVEHGAPTAADKRHIREAIDTLIWLAALKPNTVGVPAYEDATRQYLEITVLGLFLGPDAKADRLVELVHRAVPYPVFLITQQPSRLSLSLAHKRWSQGEAGKTVLEDKVVEVELRDGPPARSFVEALALARQPRASMLALYQGWIDCATALLVAYMTGSFALPRSPDHAAALRAALDNHARLEREIAHLRAQAAKESQISRRVELNLQIKWLETERAAATTSLR